MKEKICQNCEYFVQHYRRNNAGEFTEVGCGHCAGAKNGRRRSAKKICECYAEKASDPINVLRRKTIKESISVLIKSIEELSEILKNNIDI